MGIDASSVSRHHDHVSRLQLLFLIPYLTSSLPSSRPNPGKYGGSAAGEKTQPVMADRRWLFQHVSLRGIDESSAAGSAMVGGGGGKAGKLMR